MGQQTNKRYLRWSPGIIALALSVKSLHASGIFCLLKLSSLNQVWFEFSPQRTSIIGIADLSTTWPVELYSILELFHSCVGWRAMADVIVLQGERSTLENNDWQIRSTEYCQLRTPARHDHQWNSTAFWNCFTQCVGWRTIAEIIVLQGERTMTDEFSPQSN